MNMSLHNRRCLFLVLIVIIIIILNNFSAYGSTPPKKNTSIKKKPDVNEQKLAMNRIKGLMITLQRIATNVLMIYAEEILFFIPFMNLIYIPIFEVIRRSLFG